VAGKRELCFLGAQLCGIYDWLVVECKLGAISGHFTLVGSVREHCVKIQRNKQWQGTCDHGGQHVTEA